MRRRRVITVLVLCVLVGIGVVAFWPGEREPEYNGKKLSEWLEISRFPGLHDSRQQAEDAVKHIGTNGLPWLIKWMTYESPKWKDQMLRWKVGDILPWELHRLVFNREFRSVLAMEGFRILAPTSEQVSAELERLANGWPRHSSQRAWVSLHWLGPAGLPILMNVATNRTGPAKARCAALDEIGTVFSKERTNTVSNLRSNNLEMVPGLLRCLEEPNSDPTVRAAVTNALLIVAPEVLTNGVKNL